MKVLRNREYRRLMERSSLLKQIEMIVGEDLSLNDFVDWYHFHFTNIATVEYKKGAETGCRTCIKSFIEHGILSAEEGAQMERELINNLSKSLKGIKCDTEE